MLKLEKINKKLGNFGLSDINLEIPEGEYFVLLGRSGSGKTQMLELIAGLNAPDSGNIWVDNEDVTRKKIQDRNIGLVFQDYAIFPNMTVFGNIAYSLHCRKLDKKEIHLRVKKMSEELNIEGLLNRFTNNLSGGELQRVALARTLITSPKVLLLDEPLASIDASLKDDIRRIFRQLNRKGLTIVHVTHDYREAVSLAKSVGVIHNGHIIQVGPPSEVFRKPVNKFVARYSGIRNFFRVKFLHDGGVWKAQSDGFLTFVMKDDSYPREGLMIIRGDAINIHSSEPSNPPVNCFKGKVLEIFPSEYGMEITVDAGERFYVDLSAENLKLLQINELSEVWITFPPEAGIALQGTG
jgi:molybdate/tungstate transport system ATP-binding protein